MSPTLTAKSRAEPGVAGLLRPLPSSLSGLGVLEQAASASAIRQRRGKPRRRPCATSTAPCLIPFLRGASRNADAAESRSGTGLLAEASFKNVTVAPVARNARRARKGNIVAGCFPRNAHGPQLAHDLGQKEWGRIPCRDAALILRCICRRAAIALALASDLLELAPSFIGLMLHFFATCAESDGSDHCCENDSALHCFVSPDSGLLRDLDRLTRYLPSNRHSAPAPSFSGSRLFTAASAESNSGDHRRR